MGFKEVLNHRSLKKQKFRQIEFRKDRENVLLIGEHEEREKAKRKRKANRDQNAGRSDGKDNDTRKKAISSSRQDYEPTFAENLQRR